VYADPEITAIAKLYPDSTVLTGVRATVAAALPALAGRTVAHVAAHGHHDQENVLFSRLDLADGPLMAYDIQQLGAAPDHVVLSSCDVGRMVVRTGDEILGFTAALLYSGTRTVVSSVARVPDDAVTDVMYAYHRALSNGVPSPRALADCTADGSLIPFVCFGAG
jgi:CHAT domain-containing protein